MTRKSATDETAGTKATASDDATRAASDDALKTAPDDAPGIAAAEVTGAPDPEPDREPDGEAARDMHDPMLRLVVSELEAFSRLIPPADLPPPGDSDEAEDAFFDNMPV